MLAILTLLITLPLFGMDKDLSPEIIEHIMVWLSSNKDIVAFTSTCKQLRTFPIHVNLLNLRLPPQKHSWLNIICAGSSVAMIYPFFRMVDPYLPSLTEIIKEAVHTVASAAPPALSVPIGLALLVSTPRLYKKATAALEYINTSEQRVTEQRITQLASNHYSVAERLRSGSLIVGRLDIDYHTRSQAQPLLKSARACGTPKISIYVHNSSPKEYLKPCSFLAENKQLKNLEIVTADDNKDTLLSPISINSFYEGIQRNSSLQTLTLTGVALSPRLLDAIFTHKTLEELVLSGCNATKHYNFEALTKNTTLKKLSLFYFTNHHSSINDSTVPALLNFLQRNRTLESFMLRTCSLSDAAVAQLKTSSYAPKKLVVP